MTTLNIPASQNDSWGFFGTMGERAEAAWPVAMTQIAKATGEDLAAVRAFLDSRHGRHFADDVLNALDAGCALEAAVGSAVGRWLGWTVGRITGRDYGIRPGTVYLTGFVRLCAAA